ncbi:hypothetical protein THMIRHAS_04170 [Thiosulfatimonas sediminis]|uniref:Uncharacterized protein n=1 Tax=Thiosulfatimonas sediminis TaxID=2675054 RepID=A0A6F8PSN5_9GAMM|nr:hypothetical protein [Thiosulfatimonas sediminis]BBP45044.1 hypothetical protein THMIRHAS_04170 [Thiosulfatimonas sediminis]
MQASMSLKVVSASSRQAIALASIAMFDSPEDCVREWQAIMPAGSIDQATFEWGDQLYYFLLNRVCPIHDDFNREKVVSKDVALAICNAKIERLMGMALQTLSHCHPRDFETLLNRQAI